MQPILKVEHLALHFTQYDTHFHRRELSAVRDLSVAIYGGEVIAVVGASGSGKSLLAHSILGVLPYNAHCSGTIQYCGEELTQERKEALRGREIVLIPQGVTYLDPLMKVGAQLTQGDKRRTECVSAVLRRYGLPPEIQKRYPFELSGGMARRILISSAVLEKPKLIVADEPTPGLDFRAAKRVLGHLRELADSAAGVLLITHDLELALTIADRVVVLLDGKTVDTVSANDFVSGDLRHPYTKALWSSLPCNEFCAGEESTWAY